MKVTEDNQFLLPIQAVVNKFQHLLDKQIECSLAG
jgi:hypothetical protein